MSEWLQIEKKLRKLEAEARERDAGHIVEMLIALVRGMALQIDLDRLTSAQAPAQPAIKASLDEVGTTMVTSRLERLEADQEWTARDISLRLERHFEDLNKRLDALETLLRPAEPPRHFEG